jgi:tRNA(Arg) A34 adenosine deaminase TadA
MAHVPTGFALQSPRWLEAALADLPDALATPEDRIRAANVLALRNIEEGTGGPFAAIVTDGEDGLVVSAGVNLVIHSGLSAMHAEVVALQLAHAAAGTWDLGDGGARRTLSINAQPCVMCLGAVIWSGVRAVEFAVASREVEALTGFDEGPIPAQWARELEGRGIDLTTGVLREESLAVLGEFRRRATEGTAVVYNARGTGKTTPL